jgi:hypothetical protein
MGSHWHKITNHTIDYMGLGFMIFRRGIDITWGIGWVVLKVSPVLGRGIALAYLCPKMAIGWRLVPFNGPKYARAIPGPKTGSTFNRTLPIPRVMSIPCLKIITPRPI